MDEKNHEVDAAEAARALEEIGGTRREVATRVGAPSGYYLRVGVGAAALTVSQAMGDPWRLLVAALGLVLVLWSMRSYTEATGSWSMATLRENGAWRAWLMMAVMVAALVSAMLTREWVVALVGAAAILAVVPTLGPRWDADWVRSLERDA